MKEIIYLITLIVYVVFVIRFILSWIGGDFDIDADVDTDLDLSDVVTFKGVTHFLMGSSGWLSVKCFTTGNIEWYDWLIAFVIGLIFVIILFYTYKLMLKLECKPNILEGKGLIGKRAKIYLTCGKDENKYKYIITTNNNIGTLEYEALSEKFYSIGDVVTITGYNGAYYFII
jgi:hypothetical protein